MSPRALKDSCQNVGGLTLIVRRELARRHPSQGTVHDTRNLFECWRQMAVNMLLKGGVWSQFTVVVC